MTIILIVFFLSLLAGPLGGIVVAPGVTVYAHDIVLVAVLLIGLLPFLRGKKFKLPVLLYPLIGFFSIGIFSLFFNVSRFTYQQIAVSSLYLWRWGAYALVYVLLVQQSLRPRLLHLGLFSFGTCLSILGFIQYALYPELRNLSYLGWDPHLYRLFSTMLDPNFTGILIVLTIFLGMYIWKTGKSKLVIFLEILNIIALYLTYSRSSYAAFIIGAVTLILYYRKWNALLWIALFAAALVFVPKPGGKTLLLRRIDSTVSRIENWQESIRIISKSPIIGNGFNTLRFIQGSQIQPVSGEILSHAVAGVDSSILFLFATTGLLGVSAYAWVIWTATRFYASRIALFDISGTMLGSITALFIHSIFVNSLVYPWVMIWMFILLAAGELYTRGLQKK